MVTVGVMEAAVVGAPLMKGAVLEVAALKMKDAAKEVATLKMKGAEMEVVALKTMVAEAEALASKASDSCQNTKPEKAGLRFDWSLAEERTRSGFLSSPSGQDQHRHHHHRRRRRYLSAVRSPLALFCLAASHDAHPHPHRYTRRPPHYRTRLRGAGRPEQARPDHRRRKVPASILCTKL
jgi:hypothetical protein